MSQAPLNLVTRSELARLAGVSKTAITKACRSGYQLAPACVGRQLDADHPAVAAYLDRDRAKAKLPAIELDQLADAVAAILARRLVLRT
jgi:hypothetical protein